MNKKIAFYIVLMLVLLNLSAVKVYAYECTYDATFNYNSLNEDKEEFTFTVDTSQNKLKLPQKLFGKSVKSADEKVDNNYNEAELVKTLDNSCPKNVYACFSAAENIYIFLDGQNFVNYTPGTLLGNDVIYNKEDWCTVAEYDEKKSTAQAADIEFNCDYYDSQLELLKINDINSNKYMLEKEKIKNFCKTTLSYGDYNLNPCVKSCLKLAKDIADIEGTTVSQVGFCGLSDELLAWIRNIIKYIKYFLPVIVIVLGILDFIKAIASSNDDDMKKAQDKFVKRLISAALVFLVPLIIGFIMDQFGFTPEYCGVFK